MVEDIETVVIDASFVLNYLMPDEKEGEEVRKVFEGYEDETVNFAAPMLLRYEIYNALRSAVVSGRIERKKADAVIRNFNLLEIDFVEVNYNEVLDLSINCGVSFYDACYLWLSGFRGIKLKSLDKRLVGKISIC